VTGAGFRPDGAFWFYVQNRTQSWLDIRVLEPGARRSTLLLRETTAGWVDPPPEPIFLDDGGFLLASERDGFRHLYRYPRQGAAARLTSGDWEVRTIHALDRKTGWIYFSATRDDPIAENLYRVRLDGSGLERLTAEPGSHSINLGPTAGAFLDTWSDFGSPARVALHRADGARIRMIDSNPVPVLEQYRFGSLERLHIRLSDGFVLEGTLLKPPDFDPARKYPVWYETYAGPRTPTIRDSFYGGRTWDQVLAGAGILVLHCDPRSASGKGAVAAYSAYRRLGVQELKDIGEAIEWLCQRPYVDRARIGMSGVSYGGYITAYAMTHSRLFAAGVAGAPVTDWRDYDSIYTEKYMLTPEENPEGYRVSSVVAAAKDLHGRLLLIHGAIDDNVHIQNTLRLVHALQDANKRFDIMIYPPNRHGFGSPHYQRTMYEFILKSLGVPLRRRI
jgi:dipeptidyl-peptidase-4